MKYMKIPDPMLEALVEMLSTRKLRGPTKTCVPVAIVGGTEMNRGGPVIVWRETWNKGVAR
jgi:hypothetical protein